MGNNSQSRKWALVINNPLEAGLDHSTIKEILQRFSPAYYCMGDEIASTGTYHTHLFFYAPSPVRFSTVKNRFPTAHIEKAYGTAWPYAETLINHRPAAAKISAACIPDFPGLEGFTRAGRFPL